MGRFSRLLGGRLRGRRARWEQNWGVYPGELDGQPAIWTVDLGAIGAAPVSSLPVRLDVTAPYRPEDGADAGEALHALYPIEDAVANGAAERGGAYVGRVLGGGVCRYTAHLPAEPDGDLRLPGDGLVVRTEYDPEWAYVRDTLAPDARQAHVMFDLMVLRSLEESGDAPEVPRPVDFFAIFAAPEPAEAAAAELRSAGHQVTTQRDDEGEYVLTSVLVTAVAPPALHDLTWSVRELVERHGGAYDGWGSPTAS